MQVSWPKFQVPETIALAAAQLSLIGPGANALRAPSRPICKTSEYKRPNPKRNYNQIQN